MVHPLLVIGLFILLLCAFWVDARQHRIPNLVSVGGALCGLLLQLSLYGPDGLLNGALGLLVGLLLLLPFYAFGAMGAGDVKLMATVGVFIGPTLVMYATACSFFIGLPIGLLYAFWRGARFDSFRRYGQIAQCFFRTLKFIYIPPPPGDAMAMRFPYAVAILAGTALALLWLAPDSLLPWLGG